jgi:TPR repeat protein
MLASARGRSDADLTKAAGLFDKGCRGGDVSSCVNLGRHLMDGAGVTKDEAAAAKLLERACTDGSAVGCGMFGLAVRDGRGIGKDPVRALEALRLACGGGHDTSCGQAGRLLVAGETPDFKAATKLFQRACQGSDAGACYEAGSLFESGKGMGKNPVLSDMYYRRGCIMGAAEACYSRARLEASRPSGNADEAKRLFSQACSRRSATACAALKVLYGENRGAVAVGSQLSDWRRACDKGSAEACTRVGLIAAGNGNRGLAISDLRRACTGGDAFACFVQKSFK